jgi:ATP phosphoribosyltransferase regulatory subunit
MTNDARRSLLPAGLQDLLPPDAAHEAAVAERLLACFAAQGYERVRPPLVEFEDGLLSGTGAALAQQTFRLIDPVSQRMLALRSDVTPQVARIAQSRLARAPRPLRLSYAEDILRLKGTELRPERQFGQVGYELIGAEGTAADAEAVFLALEGLMALGIARVSVDLNAPTLVTSLLDGLGLDPAARRRLRLALDSKDEAAMTRAAPQGAALFAGLMAATGATERALERLRALDLPPVARREADGLLAVAAWLLGALPGLALTIDPVEHRGFEYQTGLSFSLFDITLKAELGRGGRYRIDGPGGAAESATGCTLFMDTLLRSVGGPSTPRRVFLPLGTPVQAGRELRAAGYVTVAGLAPVEDAAAEAARLDCGYVLEGTTARPLAAAEAGRG